MSCPAQLSCVPLLSRLYLAWLAGSLHRTRQCHLRLCNLCCRHSVLYDDGEREAMLLAAEKLKWLLPPEVCSCLPLSCDASSPLCRSMTQAMTDVRHLCLGGLCSFTDAASSHRVQVTLLHNLAQRKSQENRASKLCAPAYAGRPFRGGHGGAAPAEAAAPTAPPGGVFR